MAKTTPLERLEAACAAAEYGTPAYHRAVAALHAHGPDGGACGCYSCGQQTKRRAA